MTLPASWWTHAKGDPPRTCWACVLDAVNAPDEAEEEDHDPEPIGEDEDGPYCYCGHHIERDKED